MVAAADPGRADQAGRPPPGYGLDALRDHSPNSMLGSGYAGRFPTARNALRIASSRRSY